MPPVSIFRSCSRVHESNSESYRECIHEGECRSAVDRGSQSPIIEVTIDRSCFVNRLISMLMLATFAAQHFACGCSGLGTHACESRCSADFPGKKVDCRDSNIDSHSSCCGHGHAAEYDAHASEHDETPENRSHGHHICVGTHVFFVTAPRASLPASSLWHDDSSSPAGPSHFVTMASNLAMICVRDDTSPPLSSRVRRSTLCVYRV